MKDERPEPVLTKNAGSDWIPEAAQIATTFSSAEQAPELLDFLSDP